MYDKNRSLIKKIKKNETKKMRKLLLLQEAQVLWGAI